MGYNFSAVHRLRHLNEDSGGCSRLGIDTHLDTNVTGVFNENPTLNEYYHLAHSFQRDSPPPSGDTSPEKLSRFHHKRSTIYSMVDETYAPLSNL